MFLGALAGLTDSYKELLILPKVLNFENEAEIIISSSNKNGIVCKQVKVVDLVKEHKHRHLKHIIEIIDKSELSDSAKNIAKEIFNIIGIAEAEVHGIPLEKIHFHEVGAVDSIIDICGAAYLLDKIDISQTYLTTLVTGKGFVKTAHGLLPVPCPATQLILQGIPYITGDEDGEKLTPTGAAIIKYLDPKIEQVFLADIKVSYGSGEKDFISPNTLRLSLCEKSKNENEVFVIETQMDDFNSEYLGLEFQNKLFELGILDFYFTQIIMKKGRPGLLLTVLCKSSNFDKVTDFLLSFTTSIGLRYKQVKRIELARSIEKVDTEFGTFQVKVSKLKDGKFKIKPEADELMNYSIKNNTNPDNISQIIRGTYENNK